MCSIVTNETIDLEEAAKMMKKYYEFDPVGCATFCGKLIQADQDRKRIEEMEQTIATLQAQLQQKAG